jgi:hypothetical protein
MDVVLIELRVNEHLAPDRMLHENFFQPIAELAASVRPIDDSLIKHDPDADVAALERNPPTPPTITDHMIGRGAANAADRGSPPRIFLRQFVAVPIFHAFPPRPFGGGGMLGILSPPAFLPREQCSDARGIDDPASYSWLRLDRVRRWVASAGVLAKPRS